jgi:hypothetical protein
MKNKEDIIKRIKEAKVVFNNKNQLLCSINLSLEIKRNLTGRCTWSFAPYGVRNMDPRKKMKSGS